MRTTPVDIGGGDEERGVELSGGNGRDLDRRVYVEMLRHDMLDCLMLDLFSHVLLKRHQSELAPSG